MLFAGQTDFHHALVPEIPNLYRFYCSTVKRFATKVLSTWSKLLLPSIRSEGNALS